MRRVRHDLRPGPNPTSAVPATGKSRPAVRLIFGETTEITGGEHLIAERCATAEVRSSSRPSSASTPTWSSGTGRYLSDSQPTQGNIDGGLTTIEEKALGNIQKIGTRPVVDALAPPSGPNRAGPELHGFVLRGRGVITLIAAAGAFMHLFPTGQGNVVGHPVEPVIKVSANPLTVATMSEHIDVDVTGLLQLEFGLAAAGDRLEDVIDRTVNGRLTCAEVLGHREFALTRLHPSA